METHTIRKEIRESETEIPNNAADRRSESANSASYYSNHCTVDSDKVTPNITEGNKKSTQAIAHQK